MGMHGEAHCNLAIQNADLLLAFGMRFDDRVTGTLKTYAPNAKKIHIEIDPSEVHKNVTADLPLVGDLKTVLTDLVPMVDEYDHEAWLAQIADWKVEGDGRSIMYWPEDGKLYVAHLVRDLWEATGGGAIVTTDVGQHQMWAAQYYKFDKPRRWLTSGGLGTMGVGLPYAMGAALANPDSQVACITGDGSIQMCIQELSTAKQFGLPIKILNLNNRYLGMVRQWQEMFYSSRYSQTYMDSIPDFVKLAEAYGHVGIHVERPEDVEGALKRAFIDHKDDLVFLDIMTDQGANVFPMVAAGKGLSEMIMADEEL